MKIGYCNPISISSPSSSDRGGLPERREQASLLNPPDQAVPQADSRFDVPWGLPQAVGGLLLVFGLYLVASGVFYSADQSLYTRHNLEFGVIAYQFLVAAVVLTSVVLILSRFRGGLALLGFRFPGWKVLG